MKIMYVIFIKKLFLYGVIGCFSASMDTALFFVLTKVFVFQYLTANFCSVNFGILISFLQNNFFNFKTKDKIKKRAFKFFCIGYLGLLLSTLIIWFGSEFLQLDSMYVKITSVFIVAFFQFVLNYFITFKKY